MILIDSIFGKDTINIYKVTNCKTKWPQFFGLLSTGDYRPLCLHTNMWMHISWH